MNVDDHSESSGSVRIEAPTADAMRDVGRAIARYVHGGDVLLLAGPLGAGKTTFAQGFGAGLGVEGPIVSPTFTIARELSGRFEDGSPAHLVHVDAYRLGSTQFAPGEDVTSRLLDELESLGLDEELESPGADTLVLMEWGQQMAVALAPERLEIVIERPVEHRSGDADTELSSAGTRIVSITGVGSAWAERLERMRSEIA
ncbi:tRNA (adenosine(37)-N6)-threonylcarbamoyltransferase complex ATPase subunit type 1 TsaE [Bifidobacterium psychraerophilum]|uniref:tRNA (adenosine(37)-N6)-threonylcarbamoyltransferase complex ATPase subunit type 1 TsaE n=1 Tax=Bifidobacterium psychraerophilum TaxID=218140 RepID=UPI0031151AD6